MANESDDYTLLLLRELDYIVATQMLGILQGEKGSLFNLGVVTQVIILQLIYGPIHVKVKPRTFKPLCRLLGFSVQVVKVTCVIKPEPHFVE